MIKVNNRAKGPILNLAPCRCCRALKRCRILTAEYIWMQKKEVYADMVMDCFGILLSHLDDDIKDTGVCATCVDKLRDACAFRHQVLESEELFMSSVLENGNELAVMNGGLEPDINVKAESSDDVAEEYVDDKTTAHFVRDVEELAESKNELEQPATDLKTEPKDDDGDQHSIDNVTTAEHYADSVEEKVITSSKQEQNVQMPLEGKPRINRKVSSAQKEVYVNDISTILIHSNATPFRGKFQLGYRCFVCRQMCDDLDSLREHQASKHTKIDIVETLRTFRPTEILVYVDITDLTCTICSYKVQSMDELKSHLTQVHKKKFHLDVPNRIVPFKQSKENMFECQLCGAPFESFRYVERHMTVHYKNDVCNICGAGFLNKLRLNAHIRIKHKMVNLKCKQCDKVYNNTDNLRKHVYITHKSMIKPVKCPKCPERFLDYRRRLKHLQKIHGEFQIYKCNTCSLKFDKWYKLSYHIRKEHSGEKRITCQLHPYKSYISCLFKKCMVHFNNGVQKYECDICATRFAWKSCLVRHIKNHYKENKYICDHCGHVATAKRGLANHIKRYHNDYK